VDYAPAPRSVDDILAVLEQYKPDPAKVEERTRAANLEPPVTDDNRALAQFYLQRSRARGGLGQVGKQIEDLRMAAQYAKGTMSGRNRSFAAEEGDEGRILLELSRAESGGGNFLNAIRARDEMLKRMQSQGRPRLGVLLSGFVGLTTMSASMGDVAGAREHLSSAESVYVSLRQSRGWPEYGQSWTGALERARGALYLSEGKYAAAEASFRKAMQAMDAGRSANLSRFQSGERAMPLGQYLATRNGDEARLAWTMALQGRLAEAEAAARNALMQNLSFFGRDAVPTAGSLFALSQILSEQGRFREAARLAVAAAESLEKGGATPESLLLANARGAHGASLVAQQKWREAITVYETRQQGLAHDPLVLQQLGRGDLNWAYALVKTGEAKRAVPMLEQLLETQEKHLGDKDRSVAELRGYLALALAASGNRERALAQFRHAVPQLLEAARAEQASETGGTARWMRTTNVLEAYLDLLADLWRDKAPGIDASAEAFRIADVARGAIRDPALAEIARKEQDAQHRIGVLSDLLSRLLAAPPEQQLTKIIADARSDLDALRGEQAGLRRDIERRFPDYAALTAPKPLTLSEAQAQLRPGEALVSIYVAPARTYVWAIPQKGAASFTVANVGRDALAKRVAHLREALDVADASLANFPKFDLAASYALYAEILKPLEPALQGANNLLIVPHGALGHLPFAVLTTEPHVLKPDEAAAFATYRDAPWLMKRAAITQLPSVGTLATLRRAGLPTAGRREFIGFGDPMFTKTQVASANGTAVTRGVRMRNLAIAKVQSKTVVEADADSESLTKPVPVAVSNSSGLAQLAPLPDTSEELLRIAEVLHADIKEDVYLRLRASESLLKKMDLSKHRVIAFATHGLVAGDLDGLAQPALALSAPEVVGGDDDGLLTMEEILALKLDADWVVLSACNTASGDGAGAEAVSGLGRAFFYAGARALLVSNWPVETTSARMLTTGLFRQQAENPSLSRAEALRQTMLELMNGPGPQGGSWGFTYSHPMFWAPFSLVGEGSAR
jgi:CHAT domain-containing protein